MPSDGSLRYEIIDTPSDLETLAAELAHEHSIGVDLEADSMYHFQEKVCLIQLATARRNVIIDTVEIRDLGPLKPVFRNPDIRKVFHGADYDVRSLYRDFDVRIHSLFDTQLACRFLGTRETGLEAVLKNIFGVAVDKKYQRKDWSRRPLPAEMLAYAAGDVRYLVPLAQKLEEELEAKGRLSWVSEECRLLSKVRPASPEEQPLFMNCKGAGRLDSRGLAVLENLLQLRLRIARDRDRPLFKVFNSNSLLALAEAKPATPEALQQTGALSATQIDRHGRAILAAIKKALNLPAGQLPRYPRHRPKMVSAVASDRIRALRRWRETQARRLTIDPSLICSKFAMTAIAERRPLRVEDLGELDGLRQWQRRAFGKEIIAVLQKER
ncbi:MAG: ribonuclease D [Hyphomicrobiales bacterium]